MYHTPPQNKMVNTRSTVRKEKENKATPSERRDDTEGVGAEQIPPPLDHAKVNKTIVLEVKSEQPLPTTSKEVPTQEKCKSALSFSSRKGSSKSSSSSMLARRKQLELEAAEARARIQMELIDKRLEADLAQLEEEYSPQPIDENTSNCKVEKWLERSQQELDPQPVPMRTDGLCPPATHTAGTDGTVQLLASALKDLAAASSSYGQNANLLSRISTPKDLPIFAGDPMEWLQFKQAFEESTQVCNFSSKENLWRLRKCLRGPAKDAVTALLITANSPETVMSTLELQFGNPDVIMSQIMVELNKLSPMCPEYQKDIVSFSIRVKNYVAAARALGRDEYLQGVNVTTSILSKLPTVLLSKWADYSYPLIMEGSRSRLDILSEFLNEEAVKVSTCNVNLLVNYKTDSYKRKHNDHSAARSQTVLVQDIVGGHNKCRYCRVSNHKLTECKKFRRSLRRDRWQHVKRYGLCYKCMLSQHDRQTCPAPACDVDGCGQDHHSLLHYVPTNQPRRDVSAVPTDTETVTNINIDRCTVLLKVVPVNIHGPNGVVSTTALLDDGSTVSLVSAGVAAGAGVTGRRERLRVRGAWNNTGLECDAHMVDLALSNKDGTMFTVAARSVNELNLPKQNLSAVNCDNYKHLKNIKNHLCKGLIKPQVLIGQDNCHLFLPIETVSGSANEPCATRTPLGWCLHGRVGTPSPARAYQSCHSSLLITDETTGSYNDSILREIHEEVRRSFSIEALGVSATPRQNSEDLRAVTYLDRTSTLVDGRWHVGLPWKDRDAQMPDSFPNAMSRLHGVQKKMEKNEEYATRYRDRINHLLENNFAKELTHLISSEKTWYLPHFGVDNPNKKKLRLVFDAAAKTKGFCLNDYLLKGPDLLMSLFGIMLRFRENKVAVTGDIKDMFLRIKIIDEDQHALRFLFRDNPNDSVKYYAMTSLIFGANCSPFIAQYIKNKNARRYESTMPSAVDAICKQHYMDDYIDSLPNEESAVQLVKDVTYIHGQGGFHICNWASNSQTVLDSMPNETLGTTAVRFKIDQQPESERTLGLMWCPKKDTLSFDVSFKRIPEDIINGTRRPTKRDMLRVIMSIFDVYGFLSPFTINGKILLQDTWRSNINWDDAIPDRIYEKWTKWINLLNTIRNVRLPRHYRATASASETDSASTRSPLHCSTNSTMPPQLHGAGVVPPESYTNLQLHLFSDASTTAMCAVAYWRWIDGGRVHVAFIASRCRVAPVKPTSVPRLELQAALLAARLANTIVKEHRIKADCRYFWCDSTTVLHWIYNDARNYKAFVAHRLGEIDELTCVNEWRYVPTKLNVADRATREEYECCNLENEWFNGPTFLRNCEYEWPKDILKPETCTQDLECLLTVQDEIEDLPVPDPTRFSSWMRLLRATSAVLKFINSCRKLTDDLEYTTMERAEHLLLKYSQAQSFPEEIAAIKNNKSILKSSKLLTLSPYLDEHGVLRVGGRIDAAAEVSPETKRPVILDGRNYITALIVRFYHINAAHGNQEMVVNNLKQKYFIIRMRPTVKKITSQCMLCRIRKCKPEVPRMGDLPKARVAHHQRPFTFCGVDLFGPMEVTVGRRRQRRYGVLFTCLTVRAVHIEVVPTLTSDSMIMALRRMAARRGWPRHIYSDNGTNLRGADVELKRSIQEIDQSVLMDEAMNHGSRWSFIPAASPHWGGAWERLIRSVKTSLKVILKERAPRDETLITLLAEVENMVNSRPLMHVSVEPGSNEALTPNHFLLGSSSSLPHIGVFDDSDLYLRKQWRIAQRLADMYWKRWVTEVLPDMVPRRKWTEEQRPLQVGDLVLVVDPTGPRNLWPRGLIQDVFPGKDGRVRMIKLKTKTGVLTRSAARVARLPVGDECC